MLTVKEIRADLQEIRYYYSHKEMFDDAISVTGGNAILEKVKRYNQAARKAPLRLYEIYVELHINDKTQEGFADERNYCAGYIQQLNKELLRFFQKTLTE